MAALLLDDARRKESPLVERLMLQGPILLLDSGTALASSRPDRPGGGGTGGGTAPPTGPLQAERDGWTGGGGSADGDVESSGDKVPDDCEAGERCGGDKLASAERGALGPDGAFARPVVWIRIPAWAAATVWASCCSH